MSEKRKNPIAVESELPSVQIAAMNQDSADELDLMELLFRLLSKWYWIVGVALVFALGTYYYTSHFVTPLYRAQSTIYILGNRDSAINMADLNIGTALADDYIKVFDIWEVKEQVVSNLDLSYTYDQLNDMVSVKNDKNTRMLDIYVTSVSAGEAALIANEYAQVVSDYIADTMHVEKPSIMSVALEPSYPYYPVKSRNVRNGFIIGALLTIIVISVLWLLDDKIKTADDIRKFTGLAVLAVVPVEDGKTARKGKGARRKHE